MSRINSFRFAMHAHRARPERFHHIRHIACMPSYLRPVMPCLYMRACENTRTPVCCGMDRMCPLRQCGLDYQDCCQQVDERLLARK